MQRIVLALLGLAVTTSVHAMARFPDPPSVTGWQLVVSHEGRELGASFRTRRECIHALVTFRDQYGPNTFLDCAPVWESAAAHDRTPVTDGGLSDDLVGVP